MSWSRTGAYQLLHCLHQPPFTPCKCVSVNVRVQLPSDVLKMHQSQTGSPELEGIHPRYVVYLVVVCYAGCNPFALIADVKVRSDRRDRGLQSAMCHRTPRTGWQGQLASIPPNYDPLIPSPITLRLSSDVYVKNKLYSNKLCERFLWLSFLSLIWFRVTFSHFSVSCEFRLDFLGKINQGLSLHFGVGPK